MKLTQLALYGAIAYAVMKSGILSQITGAKPVASIDPSLAERMRRLQEVEHSSGRLSQNRGRDI